MGRSTKSSSSSSPSKASAKTTTTNTKGQTKTEATYYRDKGLLVELVKNGAGLEFLVLDSSSSPPVISLRQYIKNEKVWLVPPADKYGMVGRAMSIPSRPEPYSSQAELVEEMREFIHRFVDCSPESERLIAYYCLMTWVYDAFAAIPYLRFLGEFGGGKTRCLTVCRGLSYRGLLVTSPTPSIVFRWMDHYRGSLLFDEADWRESDMKSELTQILNAGYYDQGWIPRNVKVGGDWEPRFFRVYGPKIFASRELSGDHAFETRCLVVQDPEPDELRADIPRQLPSNFSEQVERLQNKLLQWRLDNLGKVNADEEALRSLDPRSCEIGSVLVGISQDKEFKAWLIDYLAARSRRAKDENPKTEVARIILDRGQPDKPLPYSEVVEIFNYARPERDHITSKKLGVILRTLGIVKLERVRVRTSTGYTFTPSSSEIERLRRKYS